MATDLLEAIGACPSCRGSLAPGAGGYVCAGCSRLWPARRGVPRFVSEEHYAGNFGFEWRRYKKLQVDADRHGESERTFAEKTGLRPEDVRGKLVLDVGVGTGRFSDVVARWGGTPVGIDLSLAVESARRNLAPYPGARVLQADVFALPFRAESFDIVFSIGVLHHTRSTRAALRAVAPLVKPGGVLAVAVYEASHVFDQSDRYRRWTTRMSYPLLHLLAHTAVPWFHLFQLARALPHGEFLEGALFRALPLRLHADPGWRVLDTFDWYSPHYQWKHTGDEARRWLEELGFADVKRLPEKTMVSVRGRRPASGPLLEPPPSADPCAIEPAPPPAWIPEKGPLRDLALLALLAADVARGHAVIAADVLAEARRKVGGRGPSPPGTKPPA